MSRSELKYGYSKDHPCEPLIWEPEDWSPAEWTVLCRVCGLPADKTERIVLNIDTIESYVSPNSKGCAGVKQDCEVTEVCPHCESEITMTWDVASRGYKAFCPVCGKRLMLCDECLHAEGSGGYCDYDSQSDSCHLNPPMKTRRLWLRLGVSTQVTLAEEAIMLGDDRVAASNVLRGVLEDGRFAPDGDSYIPEPTVVDYNEEHGTAYEPGDYDFDV